MGSRSSRIAVPGEEDEDEYEEDEEEEVIKKPPAVDTTGMPVDAPYGKLNPYVLYSAMEVLIVILFTVLAWGLYALGKDHYTPKLNILQKYNLGYVYLAAYVMKLTLSCQQMIVAANRKLAHCENPDQYIFKTMLKQDPYVRLETEGKIGRFNRAQRGIDNTRDIWPETLGFLLLSGFVFSEAALVVSIVFLIGSVWYSIGYVSSSRASGMMVRMLAQGCAMGMTVFLGMIPPLILLSRQIFSASFVTTRLCPSI